MYTLTVKCDHRDFFAYWYGIGEIVESYGPDADERYTFVVNYGSDGYRAQYQADRFASGLIFATVEVS